MAAKNKNRQNQEIVSIDILIDSMNEAVDDYISINGIDDLKKESQNVFNGALYNIYKTVYKNTRILKDNSLYNNNSAMATTSNRYNYILLNDIVDYYINDLCTKYDKIPSKMGFSVLTGIEYHTITLWGEPSCKAFAIYQKLDTIRESALADRLASGKVSPVGILGILNHEKGWNLPGVTKEVKQSKEAAAIANKYNQVYITDSDDPKNS